MTSHLIKQLISGNSSSKTDLNYSSMRLLAMWASTFKFQAWLFFVGCYSVLECFPLDECKILNAIRSS